MVRRVRGLTVVDLVLTLAVLALLVWGVRHDWQGPPPSSPPPTAAAPAP
jgi:hypothetical protein